MRSASEMSSLGRRARNAAKKRLGILDAVLWRLADRPLAAIRVQDLCEEVGIAEQTFFNTFRTKTDVLVFFVMLWSVEVQWRIADERLARDGVQALFRVSGEQHRQWPWLMPEIIVHQIQSKSVQVGRPAPPTLAEKLLRFPGLSGIEELEPQPIQQIIRGEIDRATSQGELAPDIDPDFATRLLCGLFFGAAASDPDPDGVADLLDRGFARIWRGFQD